MTPEYNIALAAARNADWQQVVLNGGPPCFHLIGKDRFCLRAQRWPGHGSEDHEFVSLADLLSSAALVEHVATICAIEADYWADVEDKRLIQHRMGAMGAASNIRAAVLRGVSVEQYREEVARRPHAAREAPTGDRKGGAR